ncbi:MAG: class I SAM-dependent methyltransferase [Patescibacteria group bacterium]|nr:class I SAM-dependent methyltransferase [Patescibacteria group bacterium]
MEVKHKIKITTDNDKIYEINKTPRKILNFFLIPVLNNIPRKFFVGSSKKAKSVNKHATTHRALEIVYSFNYKLDTKEGLISAIFTYLWNITNNAKALRNRLRLVKKELIKSIREIKKEKIIIASLACGSTRSVIEAVAEAIKKNIEKNFKIYAIDKNEDALQQSKSLAEKLAIERFFIWQQSSVNEFLDSTNEKFDIIEMVGFLDYKNDEESIELFNKIHSKLNENGVFITGNIRYNPEMKFLINVVGWPHLIFRTENDLLKIIEQTNFKGYPVEIIKEPQNIHMIAKIGKIK